ncbi:DUF3040 domain-containing protein [Streptomyces albicerus]|uniref:DUF3040 domain-containing protein n=1 Tax=Streptomyces albicerus TaxID=2569859 RepID=UPI00124AEC22|nr:DUF3040 domain-containing protein [Streptomyces albicerus]
MNPSMDEERTFSRIERCLARDDPELAARIDRLNNQFTGEPPNGPGKKADRLTVTTIVVSILALVGLILAALLMDPPERGAQDPAPPHRVAPGISTQVQSQRRVPRTPRTPAGRHPVERAARHACT